MARFWHLQIDSLYLTDTGLNGGRWYQVECPLAYKVFNLKQGNTTNGADGSPFNESPLTLGKGLPLEFFIKSVDTDPVFIALQSKMDALSANIETTIVCIGEPGTFTVKAVIWYKSDNETPFQFAGFSSGTVKNVSLRFQVTEIISISKVS